MPIYLQILPRDARKLIERFGRLKKIASNFPEADAQPAIRVVSFPLLLGSTTCSIEFFSCVLLILVKKEGVNRLIGFPRKLTPARMIDDSQCRPHTAGTYRAIESIAACGCRDPGCAAQF